MAECLFCKIVAGEIPATIVKRSEDVLAFRDIDARAPAHVLVIPTKHVAAVRDAKGPEGEKLLGRCWGTRRRLRASWGSMRVGIGS